MYDDEESETLMQNGKEQNFSIFTYIHTKYEEIYLSYNSVNIQ